jgi:hypothetical protein
VAGANVLQFEIGVVLKDLLNGLAGGELVQVR